MASTYVNNLRLNEMATGDGSGTWGTTTNTNLELIGQALGYGTRAIANASTDNITIADGASDSDRAMYLKLTGGGQACTVTLLPNTASKVWMLENATSYTLTFTQGSGANVAILAGETKIIATDGGGSGGIVYDVLTDTNLAGTTKTAALTNAGALSNQGTVTVGVDDTGYDVKFFGATSGAYMLWDESADDLKLVGAAGLTVAGNIDIDGTANLDVVDIDGATQADGTITVGVDDTGYDVKFFGATASAYMLWDESADDLILAGAARVVVPASGLVIASTAVSSTAAELNLLDGLDRGSILYGNASSATTVLGQGTADQVLTSDGTDISWADAAGGVDGLTGLVENNSVWLGNDPSGTTDTAAYNVALGTTALDAVTTGDKNVSIGYGASGALTTGYENIAVGYNALTTHTVDSRNVAIGYEALTSAAKGEAGNNVSVGWHAGYATTSGGANTFVGSEAGDAITTFSYNTALGFRAMSANLSSSDGYNTAIGSEAAKAITGGYNTYLGARSGDAASSGDSNTAVGADSLGAQTTASNNTAVGKSALVANTTGPNNVAIGSLTLDAATTAEGNTAVGQGSMSATTTGASNVAVGLSSLYTNTTGGSNTAIGKGALFANTTASSNTGVGYHAGYAITDGHTNTFVGSEAGDSITTGDENTAVGHGALDGATTANGNTAVGTDTMAAALTGDNNTAVGYNAMLVATGVTGTTAIGNQCLDAATTGDDNTALGSGSLGLNTSGSQNTAVGAAASDVTTTGVYNTVIGYGADPSAAAGNSQIVIGYDTTGTANQTATLGYSSNTASLALDGSDTSWAAASDVRLKDNVEDSLAGLEFINELRPITYKWKAKKDVPHDMPEHDDGSDAPCKGTGKTNHGFIAQEVKAVIDKYDSVKDGHNLWQEADSGTQTVAPSALIPMLTKAVQELSTKVEELEDKLNNKEK